MSNLRRRHFVKTMATLQKAVQQKLLMIWQQKHDIKVSRVPVGRMTVHTHDHTTGGTLEDCGKRLSYCMEVVITRWWIMKHIFFAVWDPASLWRLLAPKHKHKTLNKKEFTLWQKYIFSSEKKTIQIAQNLFVGSGLEMFHVVVLVLGMQLTMICI